MLHHIPKLSISSKYKAAAVDPSTHIANINGLTMTLQIRLGEKEGLDSALQFFEDRTKRLDQLEYYQVRPLLNSHDHVLWQYPFQSSC